MSAEKIISYLKEKLGPQKNQFLAAATLAGTGSFLVIEHLYTAGFDRTFGHEWLGLIFIFSGVVVGYRAKNQK